MKLVKKQINWMEIDWSFGPLLANSIAQKSIKKISGLVEGSENCDMILEMLVSDLLYYNHDLTF